MNTSWGRTGWIVLLQRRTWRTQTSSVQPFGPVGQMTDAGPVHRPYPQCCCLGWAFCYLDLGLHFPVCLIQWAGPHYQAHRASHWSRELQLTLPLLLCCQIFGPLGSSAGWMTWLWRLDLTHSWVLSMLTADHNLKLTITWANCTIVTKKTRAFWAVLLGWSVTWKSNGINEDRSRELGLFVLRREDWEVIW